MPSAVSDCLTEEDIEDLLFAARTGSLKDLQETLENISAPPSTLWPLAIDDESGNGVLHMAAANGHTNILKHTISTLPSDAHQFLDLPNHAGNTALHWASLNGQTEVVKLLVAAGANAALKNAAGHDAAYEAERADKTEVVEYLLKECEQLDTGVGGSSTVEEQNLDSVHGNGDDVPMTESEPGKTKEHEEKDIAELENGVAGIATHGKRP